MRLNEIQYTDAKPIEGYGPGFFRVGGQVLYGAVIVGPKGTMGWAGYDDAEPLLVSANLFDVFSDESGKKLSADKKSLAYSLTYRDKEATLTAGKVDEAHARILDALVAELPVQIR